MVGRIGGRGRVDHSPHPARRLVLSGGPDRRLLRRGPSWRPAVRISRRGALLLPPVLASPAGVVGGAAAALGAGRQWRPADAGQPDGGGPLPGKTAVRSGPLSLGGPALYGRARGAGLLGYDGP